MEYKKITMDDSVEAYTDSYIIRDYDSVPYLSLWGQPQKVQAIYAGLTSNASWHWIRIEGRATGLNRGGKLTCRNKRLGDVLHKVIWSPELLGPSLGQFRKKVVYGDSKEEIVDFAYRLVSAIVPTPMKPEWKYWLWEEILEPEAVQLETFGHIQVAYEIEVPSHWLLEGEILKNLDVLDKDNAKFN